VELDDEAKAEDFIARWQGLEGGQERANYVLYLVELCDLLGVNRPKPANATHESNDYVFERVVIERLPDGAETHRRIDLYKRNCFVLEAKQSRIKGAVKEVHGQRDLAHDPKPLGARTANRGWDTLLMNARQQAQYYARLLPVSHGWPPFVLVCDVGHVMEIYADFSGQGKNYSQFPDRQGFRIYLEDLRDPTLRARLAAIWSDPHSLDPARATARVTREAAERLATLSKRLEKHPDVKQEHVATFLMRSLFTMFAQSVGLLPPRSFSGLLDRLVDDLKAFSTRSVISGRRWTWVVIAG
jgi:hypothetical protein